ncbi:carboxymuconolactone decarboxylase family protei n [Desulfonema ishimotonii]|uniref:Carboxymuconolactone decarboxylase family protei n n=1 Tax=Desulfonema ishimotonii TaxID=45657 RepID=A0A401FUE0_9BACT|nr:carboxymuconolactone decarboxylase family protein [Desulfonema ishimotonii]GBC60558.1 carboxymuconolactone decarboxylase family protei n [Desulfonema ishimotonii]
MAATKLYKKEGDDKAKAIQENIEKQFGFLPEVFQAMGNNGDFLESMMKLSEAAGKNLDKKTKELICVAVSAVTGCGYCLEAHRAMALQAGITEEEITAAVEVAAMMSAFNNFNKALGMNHDIKA